MLGNFERKILPKEHHLTDRKMKFTADSPGYKGHVYPEKITQMAQVTKFVEEQGFIPKELIENEVSWFYG
jgi:glutamate dehydrogenase